MAMMKTVWFDRFEVGEKIDDVFRVAKCHECKIPVDAVDPTTESVE